MRVRNILLLFVTFMIIISSVSAAQTNLGTFIQDECFNLLQVCDTCTYNNITSVIYPNNTVVVSNVTMSRDETDYTYNFCNTSTVGTYRVTGYGDLDGTKTGWAYEFDINVIGLESTQARTDATNRGIYFTLVISILFFLAFIFSKQKPVIKWTYFIFFFLFALITLNILFVALQTETVNPQLETFFDGFTAIFWYIFWFAAGLLALMWVFTFLQTYLYNKNMQNMQRFGGEGFR